VHVAVLLQHYHTPDCATAARPWSLVQALARHHDVTVLTTDAWRKRRLTRRFEWVPEDARMRELAVPYANEMTTGQRLRSYLGYAAQAAWTGASQMPRPDLVYASSTPLTVGAVGAALATRWQCPWVFEVRDLWPDFPIQMGAFEAAGPARPLLEDALYKLERALYRSAARVIAVSPAMAAHVRRFVPAPTAVSVPYGTDFDILDDVTQEDTAALRCDLGLSEESAPVVLYAGSFGRANDLPTLVEAARRLQNRSDVHFVFAGRGYHRPLLERAARELPGVHLPGPQPYPQALALFRAADLSLVPFLDRPVLRTNAPSKFFDSLAAGTPVVVTSPGWTKTFVEEHGCGWYVPPERPQALADRIQAVLENEQERRQTARRASQAAREHFDRRVHMDSILSIIEEIVR
jgi:glycosyltransferase involved in cell wall biosynthesis